MALPRIAKPFRRRLPAGLTAADWRRIAEAPSYRAPRPRDVLDPRPFDPPGPPRMSAEERALLDAVIADPDADEPRLRYADWCDRQGDGRGTFIRQQIALSGGRQPHESSGTRGADTPRSEWTLPFAPWSARDIVFRRGFVEGLSISGRAFITLGEPLFRMTPLRDIRLVAVGWYVNELARTPHLAKVERLDLSGNHVGPGGMRELAGSPLTGRLTGLNLSHNSLGPAGVWELLLAPWRGQLRELSLAGNELNAPAVAELLADAALAGLTDLDLSQNALTDLPDDWPRLERLSLAGSRIGPSAVVSVGRIETLQALDLMHCRLGPDVADAIAGSALRLELLELGFNDIEDAGAGALAGEALAGVWRLGLRANRLGPAGAAVLAAEDASSVIDLDLMTNQLGDAGVFAVVAGDGFACLERLNVANNGVTDAGVRRLAASGAVGGLTVLSLAWNPFGDAGVKALAACPDLAGLRELDLTGVRFGSAGAKALAESLYLASLRRLVVGENHQLPDDAVGLLRERFDTMTGDASSIRR